MVLVISVVVFIDFLLLTSVECFFIPKIIDIPIDDKDSVGSPLYLTPLIESGHIEKAQKLSKVKLDGIVSHSGLLTVNEPCGSNLFFWFFPAKHNWTSSSTLLWLQGGPGATSMFGLFEEIGPYIVTKKGLKKRKYSWNKHLNLIFIDNPVGTGYSFTKYDNCYPTNETAVGNDLYKALIQIFTLFPKIQQNSFYVSGESYGGKYVPAISYTIHKNNPTANITIKLRGLLIGNGWSDPSTQISYHKYLFNLGLIDSKQKKQYINMQHKFKRAIESQKWNEAEIIVSELIVAFNTPYNSTLFSNTTGLSQYYDYVHSSSGETSYWSKFIQSKKTRKAIHVGSLDFLWGDNSLKYLLQDTVHSVKPWIEILLEQYFVLFYNGELDIVCGYPMMVNMIRSLKWSGAKKYKSAPRVHWYVGTKLAGYYKNSGHLTEVLVRNANHMVPLLQPKWAFEMVKNFTSEKC
uniref:Carboxypeptidase n=1 Tax=Clastoptera arizonana TaxID=38151 RepID=A0A1B6CZ11_9HEMI